MKKFVLGLFVLFSFHNVFSMTINNISCKYSDGYKNNWDDSKFFLKINSMTVNMNKATLDYSVLINVKEDGATEDEIWIDKNKKLSNVLYNGIKYKDHFKFVFDLSRVTDYNGSSGASANLIINPTANSSHADKYGKVIESFNSILDVSYNDHHGDYITLSCTRKF